MNNEFKLAMQLTLTDALSGVASVARRNILGMGEAGKQVARDFDLMQAHITKGLKAVAVANYAVNKIKPGVADAAELQENMIEVRMALMRSGKDANALNSELKQVRATAVELQKITPFSSSDVVQVQKELLTSGVDFGDVVGRGATRAAMMLATITKAAPEATAGIMLGIGVPYHLKGGDYGVLADEIQRHVMSGRMKMPQLEAALPYAAPYTKAYGVPWKDLLTGLAVLGEQGQLGSHAGVGLKDFYERLTASSRISRRYVNAMNRDLLKQGKAPLQFWDKQGELLPTHEIIKSLRQSFGSYNRKIRMTLLQKIFGEQGGQAALNLMATGTGSWEFVRQKSMEVAGAEDKMTESLKGFNRSAQSLSGTMKSTAASIFDPWLVPLAEITNRANTAVAAVGKFAEEHPKAADAGNGLLAAGIAMIGGYGAYNLFKGGMYGKKVLGGLGGLKGLSRVGFGIAEGKAVQAATGVTPVFVTNWPGGAVGGGGIGDALPGALPTAARTHAARAAALAAQATFAGYAAGGAAVAGVPLSMMVSNAMKENGWGPRAFGHSGKDDDREYDVMGIGRKRPMNEIKIDLQIDGTGRVFSRSNDMNTQVSAMPRGEFFEGMMKGH